MLIHETDDMGKYLEMTGMTDFGHDLFKAAAERLRSEAERFAYFNAVYLYSLGRWIRLDARGNHEGVNAQFSTGKEILAFPVQPELGEEDGLIIYPGPSHNVIEALTKSKTLFDLMENLPYEI